MINLIILLRDAAIGIYQTAPWLFKFYIGFNLFFMVVKKILAVDTSSRITKEQKENNRILIIGAGFSGIGMGIILKMAGMNFLILEKSNTLGGTWNYNKFPGAATDAKAAAYSFTFYFFPHWKRIFPSRDEILSYIFAAVNHYSIGRNIKYDSGMKSAKWDELTSSWNVETEKGQIYNGRFLINCLGFLHKPNIPKIKGMESFKGRMFHSARWEDDVDYTGKNVGVIGSGCTAIQVVPEVALLAKQVTMFSRGMTAVIDKASDIEYGPFWRFLWRICPGVYHLEHFLYALRNETTYYAFDDNWFGRAFTKKTVAMMESQVKDPKLREKFKFETPLTLCKRLPIYHNWYTKFIDRGCQIETAGIEEITSSGIKTKDGKHLEFDIIVFCTGFDMFHYRDTKIEGRGGFEISKEWDSDVPYARQGCQIKGCPNYFMMMGPQAGQIHGTGSVTYGEYQAELIWRTIRYTLENGFKNFEVNAEKFEQWKRDYASFQKSDKSWLNKCVSWYHKNGKVWQPYLWHSYSFMMDCKWSDIASQYTFK